MSGVVGQGDLQGQCLMTYRICPFHADLPYDPVVLEWPYSSGSAKIPGRRTKGLPDEVGRSYYNPSITRAAGHRQHSRKHVCILANDTDEVPSRTEEEARSCMELPGTSGRTQERVYLDERSWRVCRQTASDCGDQSEGHDRPRGGNGPPRSIRSVVSGKRWFPLTRTSDRRGKVATEAAGVGWRWDTG